MSHAEPLKGYPRKILFVASNGSWRGSSTTYCPNHLPTISPTPLRLRKLDLTNYRSINALRDQLLNTVLNALRVSMVDKTPRRPGQQSRACFNRFEQQCTGVRADRATVETSHQSSPTNTGKLKLYCGTLCIQGCLLLT